MTIAAESFAGRVLAVFSRRSPGFRPQPKTSRPPSAPGRAAVFSPDSASGSGLDLDGLRPRNVPAHHAVTGPSLVDATGRWKSLPLQERLQLRSQLLAIAGLLTPDSLAAISAHALDLARESARDLDIALANARVDLPIRDYSLDRDLDRDLDRVRALRRSLINARDLDLANARDATVDRDLLIVGYLADVVDFARDLVIDLDRTHVLARTHNFNRDLDSALARARDRAVAVDGAIVLALALVRDRALYGDRGGDLHPVRALDIVEAQANLLDAADNFVGADLSTVNLARVDLVGVRWNSDTRWPTPGVEAELRRASDEEPPGSGIFIVRSEGRHAFAAPRSPAPSPRQ